MNLEDRFAIERVLRKIPERDWQEFLSSKDGAWLQYHIDAVRRALAHASGLPKGTPPRPIEETIDALGHQLLADKTAGAWVRRMILESLSSAKWARLAYEYNRVRGKDAQKLTGNMTQSGTGSKTMAAWWRTGSRWAYLFCEVAELPPSLGERGQWLLPDDENIYPPAPLPALHGFQEEAYRRIVELLRPRLGRARLLSLPTGAGKTRVTVDAICDRLAHDSETAGARDLVIWIAQSIELQQQAWECFRQVWQVPPRRNGEAVQRRLPLRIIRGWGGRDPEDMEFPPGPTVLVAGVQQLHSWVRRKPEFFDLLPTRRLLCTVVDEAQSLVTNECREVLVALGQRRKREWLPVVGAPPVIGLSATPWRSNDAETRSLRRYFQRSLLRPASLGNQPVCQLQKAGILAEVDHETLAVGDAPPMTAAQQRHFALFGDLPADYLKLLGAEAARNGTILRRLMRLGHKRKTLVFACSIVHAEVLTTALNRMAGQEVAHSVTSDTLRAQRAVAVQRFREGELRFLVSIGVLAAGFDAPQADVVCITRPTTSAARYEQMVGRGLRGPRNGGKARCLVLDVQDGNLPMEVQSYERVLELWDGKARAAK